MDIARRDLLTLSGLAVARAMLEPSVARAQAPKRGGTLTLRVWDPPHFDPYLLPAVWDPALKNYGPNLGFDYGGRVMAAWLER